MKNNYNYLKLFLFIAFLAVFFVQQVEASAVTRRAAQPIGRAVSSSVIREGIVRAMQQPRSAVLSSPSCPVRAMHEIKSNFKPILDVSGKEAYKSAVEDLARTRAPFMGGRIAVGSEVSQKQWVQRELISRIMLSDASEMKKWIDSHGSRSDRSLEDLNFKDKEGNTPLHYVVMKDIKDKTDIGDSRDKILMLLKDGVYVNTRNEEGNTPLHIAAQKYDSEWSSDIIDLLLKNGANIKSVNNKGETVLDLLKEKWYSVKDGQERWIDRVNKIRRSVLSNEEWITKSDDPEAKQVRALLNVPVIVDEDNSDYLFNILFMTKDKSVLLSKLDKDIDRIERENAREARENYSFKEKIADWLKRIKIW